ncbi:MAG: 1-acyl-sn-glycerol-3-phosphate acyltransferase, partial [Deltaproteobacteria bacterium]|nr:1-acyl-sn-glycerol-3-phosphate acyltransferase [Deltaproteobacteria bacterium]
KNDVIYHEKERLRKHAAMYKGSAGDERFYRNASKGLASKSQNQLANLLERFVLHYLDEIAGNFNPLIYGMATRVIPGALTMMLNTMSPFRILTNFPEIPTIDKTLIIGGETTRLKRLKELGAVMIYVPAHQSNLDSPLLGYAIYRADLPPVLYGAGLNLFQLPLFHFFMNRLGAYKVDRLKTSPLYKRCLKEFATVTLELGYDHLFFPGGTRSRSGAIEPRLKKGLLGAVVRAFVNSRMRGVKTRFLVVPVTVSYHLVLEAGTLIEDHLKEQGKSRYIIMDDESSKPAVILNFIKRLISLEGKVYLNFCDPIDPFGNGVDDEGNSLNRSGRAIDIESCVTRNGKAATDSQRDGAYTEELAQRIRQAYISGSTLLTTQAAAFVVFEMLFRKSASGDLFKFLRDEAYNMSVPFEEAERALQGILERLGKMEKSGGVKLEETVRNGSAFDVLMNAVKYFGLYHKKPVIVRKGNRLFTMEPDLLYYYRNRLSGYGLEI